MKGVHELNIHEYTEIEHGSKGKYRVIRVPGGWIYHFLSESGSHLLSSTFVPYHEKGIND